MPDRGTPGDAARQIANGAFLAASPMRDLVNTTEESSNNE